MHRLNIFFLLSLILVLTGNPKANAAGPIDNLKPGEWHQVPNSELRPVAPDPPPPGFTGPQAVISAWSGGAYDSNRDRLIVWGGGHADYGGNELYVFDINSFSWSRIWGPSPNISPVGGSCSETYSDGNPSSRHTYDGLEYIPSIDRFWAHGGSLYCGNGGFGNGTWTFNFTALSWERKEDSLATYASTPFSAYDPVTGHVFVQRYADFLEYDPLSDTWTKRGRFPAGIGGRRVATIDPIRRKFLIIGEGQVLAFDLTNPQIHNPVALTTTGDTAPLNGSYPANYPGVDYDPVTDQMVAWIGGADVYTLDMDTLVWTKRSPASTNTVIPTASASKGTHGRFRYIPSKNAFIVVNNIDQDVYFYKLSADAPSSDATAPTVSITSPASGATVSKTITVSANASDNVGVAGVQFQVDGVNLGAEDTTSPYSVSWDTTKATNASHTLSAVARDAAGNTKTATRTVTVANETVSGDTTPPTISITSPASGATVSGKIDVTANASDNVKVVGVQFKLDGVNLGTEDTSSPYRAFWDTTKAQNGSHSLSAVARDAAGNTKTALQTVTVSNGATAPSDTTAPTVSITSPASGATVSATTNVSANANDNIGVAGVQFKVDGVNLGTEDTTSPYSVSWDTTKATNASHTLSALGRDAAGNKTTAVQTVTVSNGSQPPPSGQINIPLNTWVAVPAGEVGEAACPNGGCKHMRLAYNSQNGRIYFNGGDYSGPSGIQSGRNETFSYDIPTDTWTLEHPYCPAPGNTIAAHPDETGWIYDSTRKVFWMVPGYQGGITSKDQSVCGDTSLWSRGQMMTFDPATNKWTNPGRKDINDGLGLSAGTHLYAQYDPVKDQIYQLMDNGIAMYDIKTDTWTKKTFGLGSFYIMSQRHTAFDPVGRNLYVLPANGKMIKYNVDTQVATMLQGPSLVGASEENLIEWDPVNNILIATPYINDSTGQYNTLHIYHPDTNTWEMDVPINQPQGITVRGRHAIFDPQQNVLLLMGVPNGAVPYLFLYRYGNGSSQ